MPETKGLWSRAGLAPSILNLTTLGLGVFASTLLSTQGPQRTPVAVTD